MQDFRGLDRQQWHKRYVDQAGWTEYIRKYIFNKINPRPNTRILEVGSGTGAVIKALQDEGYHNITGLDLDYPSLAFARANQPSFTQILGDGHHLPFDKAAFYLTYCHYLLIWASQPALILSEMRRVTQAGGWVLALAEPDHQARIDYPAELEVLGKHQTQALRDQGVDSCLGRKIRSLFMQTGLLEVETGILSAQWQQSDQSTDVKTEWSMIRADLEDILNPNELANYQQQDRQARAKGERVLFIPTFYALGKVP